MSTAASAMIPIGTALPEPQARAPGPNHPAWTRTCFAMAKLMVWDEELWCDGRLDPGPVLDRLERECSRPDVVLLWNTYNGGIDDRTEFDYWRDLPGLEAFCAGVRARGIRMMLPYKHWDRHSRDGGGDHPREMAELVRRTGIDGVFLDCSEFPADDVRAAVEAVKPDIVWCPEATSPEQRLDVNAMSFFQFQADARVPGVPRLRWIDRRHRQIETRRYAPEHTAEIHRAWLSGGAMLVWENVFGYWAPLDPRSRSLLRAMLPAQRRFAALLVDGDWNPWVPCLLPDVHASRFEDPRARLWTIVNRAEDARWGTVLEVPHRPGERWYDVISGRRLEPRVAGGTARIELGLRPRGIGGVIAILPEQALATPDADFDAFLAGQAATDAAADWRSPPRREEHARTPLPHRAIVAAATPRPAAVPAGMVRIGPWCGQQVVSYRMREIGFLDGDPDHWHPYDAGLHQRCLLRRQVRLDGVAIDRDLVTNRAYAAFLAASGWRPRMAGNFLRHWIDGRPPAGAEDDPVAWVDLEDARAFAQWAGKRLPTDAEWQRAAQGPLWAKPPAIAESPEGIRGLCGRLWQWTDSEHTDGHTRYALVRGGSSLVLAADASSWYVEHGPQPVDHAVKLLLIGPASDRFATVGFRCAVDLQA